MSPTIPTFTVSTLEAQITTRPTAKPTNPPIQLHDCELKELVQYKCNIQTKKGSSKGKNPDIVCEPVVRWLRRCAGGLSVETTVWEEWRAKREGAKGGSEVGGIGIPHPSGVRS
ncbi:hypothetical protein BDW02DRAFT_568734 [Decorospora gaudefroyi]|uniref:Mitochondrial export protein Som1 n=1 Tax=Decorospora gaudefroyi TaxID=184978 RepID=A0A6A5KGG1_9PLEO|nr:hypothetical protein BDW02DRAFT_568734 [Decorospora gaudefroyi]